MNLLQQISLRQFGAGCIAILLSTALLFAQSGPPSIPVISSTLANALGQPSALTLTWEASSGAASYRIQVSTNNTFTSLIIDQNAIGTTSFDVSQLPLQSVLYWRVSATNASGSSPWALSQKFQTSSSGTLESPLIPPVTAPGVFTVVPTPFLNVQSGNAAWGDYDGDGDLDVVVVGDNDARLTPNAHIYRNDGGTFVDIGAPLVGVARGKALWGDYDHDGDLDLLLVGAAPWNGVSLTMRVYRNDNGVFTNVQTLVGPDGSNAAWVDYDNDGDLDITVEGVIFDQPGNTGRDVAIIYRNDNGTFVDINAPLRGVSEGAVTWVDYDNDGDLDLFMTGDSSGVPESNLYRNDNGTFVLVPTAIPGFWVSDAAWADYDHDGDSDLVISGQYGLNGQGHMATRVYRNDGNGNFVNINASLSGVWGSAVAWGDYNNDGRPDLAVSGFNGSYVTKVYRNSLGTFVDSNEPFTGVYYGSLAWGDYDNDGDLDLLLTGSAPNPTPTTILYQNNTVPPAPSISGMKFNDLNGNGVQEAGEPGLSGWQIQLTQDIPSPPAPVMTTTNAQGNYIFRNLQPGTYIISEVQQPNWQQTFPVGSEDTVVLSPGQTVTNQNFGNHFLLLGDIGAGFPGGYSAIWGDYDNDGDLDMLIVGGFDSTSGSVLPSRLYRNDHGSFVDAGITFSPGYVAAWGDYDNDGDLDLVIQGATGPNNSAPITKIYQNDNGTFVDINAGLMGLVGSVAWGDYDNDGDLDLIVTGSPDNGNTFFSKIYRNDNGTFVEINANLPGVWASSVAWGDYDNDGDLDFALLGYGSQSVTTKIYRNDNGTFVDSNIPLPQVNSGALAWGDYDNDGRLDLFLSGAVQGGGGAPLTKIFHNTGNGFVDINAPLTQLCVTGVAWGDFDNDGDLDLVYGGAQRFSNGGPTMTKVYRNDNGTFVDANVPLAGTWFTSVAWGDYDNDGDLDLLLAGPTLVAFPYEFITKIYRNNGGTNAFNVNTAPTAPASLSSTVNGNSVTLNWTNATDAQTPQNGLTYNLRIGSTAMGTERVSPMANAATGYRKVVDRGNTDHPNSRTIGNLPNGTYHWSVQSIDEAYAGSSFPSEQLFVVDVHQDTTPVAVKSIAPYDQETNVSPGAGIHVVFTGHINTGSVNGSSSFLVNGLHSGAVLGYFSFLSDTAVIFTPFVPFTAGDLVTVNLTNALLTFSGAPFIPFSSQFTIAVGQGGSNAHIVVPLSISDNGPSASPANKSNLRTELSSSTLDFGVDSLATYCRDALFGEASLPPPPPPGSFDVRFLDPRGFNVACFDQGLTRDFRQYNLPTQIDSYLVGIQGVYPFTISWPNLSSLYSGPVTLKNFNGGTAINVDMKTTTSVIVSDPSDTRILIVAQEPAVSSTLQFRTFTQSDYALRAYRLGNGHLYRPPTPGNVRDTVFNRMGWKKFGLYIGIPRPDSLRSFSWMLFKNYAPYLKRFLPQTGPAHGFDFYGGFPWRGQRLCPIISAHNNHLAGEQFILKFNIAASDLGVTPSGFGSLTFNDPSLPGNPCNGMTIRAIMNSVDSALTYWRFHSLSYFAQLDSCLSRLNSAFLGPMNIISSLPLKIAGANTLGQVPYLRLLPAQKPEVVVIPDIAPEHMPKAFALYQNYPNPFNPVTAISFDLMQSSIVNLRIYNILGQEVTTVLNGDILDAGYQSVDFDASALSSGVYFYRLSVEGVTEQGYKTGNNFSDIKKMLLVK